MLSVVTLKIKNIRRKQMNSTLEDNIIVLNVMKIL